MNDLLNILLVNVSFDRQDVIYLAEEECMKARYKAPIAPHKLYFCISI